MLLKPFRCVVDCVSWILAILCCASISLAKPAHHLWSRKEVFYYEIGICSQLERNEENIFSSWEKNVFYLSNSCASVYLDLICQQVLCPFFLKRKLSCFSKFFQSTMEIYVNGSSKILMLMKITHSAKFWISLKYQSMGGGESELFLYYSWGNAFNKG